MKGSVKFFDQKKGYGFINVEGRQKDVFVHYSGISGNGRRNLSEHDTVEFDIMAGQKGDQAVNVVKL